jgi:hypothetical protein
MEMIPLKSFKKYDSEYNKLERRYLNLMEKMQKITSTIRSQDYAGEIVDNDAEIIILNYKLLDIYTEIRSDYKTAFYNKNISMMYMLIGKFKKWILEITELIDKYNKEHAKNYRTSYLPERRFRQDDDDDRTDIGHDPDKMRPEYRKKKSSKSKTRKPKKVVKKCKCK